MKKYILIFLALGLSPVAKAKIENQRIEGPDSSPGPSTQYTMVFDRTPEKGEVEGTPEIYEWSSDDIPAPNNYYILSPGNTKPCYVTRIRGNNEHITLRCKVQVGSDIASARPRSVQFLTSLEKK